MLSFQSLINPGACITALAFLTAYLLSFWPGRRNSASAAILYSIGILINLGLLAWSYLLLVRMSYGLSDSGSPNSVALVGLVLPVVAIIYAISAVVLLWPPIPQHKAMRWGKVLHLTILPLLAILAFAITYQRVHGLLSNELKWLVYGLLWFRIREGYPKKEDAAASSAGDEP
jgi:hypothetical protein